MTSGMPEMRAASAAWALVVGGKGMLAHGPVDCGPLYRPPLGVWGGTLADAAGTLA
jgi:hypothetical protein